MENQETQDQSTITSASTAITAAMSAVAATAMPAVAAGEMTEIVNSISSVAVEAASTGSARKFRGQESKQATHTGTSDNRQYRPVDGPNEKVRSTNQDAQQRAQSKSAYKSIACELI
jgi:hypothetical protein